MYISIYLYIQTHIYRYMYTGIYYFIFSSFLLVGSSDVPTCCCAVVVIHCQLFPVPCVRGQQETERVRKGERKE